MKKSPRFPSACARFPSACVLSCTLAQLKKRLVFGHIGKVDIEEHVSND